MLGCHSLSPSVCEKVSSLSSVLAHINDPHHDQWCQQCRVNRKYCSRCRSSPENMYYTFYYTVGLCVLTCHSVQAYYAGYYGEYYQQYYSDALLQMDKFNNPGMSHALALALAGSSM